MAYHKKIKNFSYSWGASRRQFLNDDFFRILKSNEVPWEIFIVSCEFKRNEDGSTGYMMMGNSLYYFPDQAT